MAERSLRVLLIEDDPDDFVIARDLLAETENLRIDLDWAPTYEQGLEAVRRGAHDVFIIDYFLGTHVGTELLREAARVGCRAPMIVLTGQPSQEVDIQTMQGGAVEFLVKGWLDSPGLERAIRHAVERKRVEEEQRLLAEAGKLLTGSLDYATTLSSIARLVVPALGDCCVIDIPDSQSRLRRMVTVANDPRRERVLREMRDHYQLDRIPNHPAHRVLETGESVFVPEVTAATVRTLALEPDEVEAVRRLRPTSFMLVPIKTRNRTLGVLSVATFGARRPFDKRDLHLAEELARRAAVATDNARLYREAQETEERLRRHAARLQVLDEASRLFTAAGLDRGMVLDSMIRLVASRIGDVAVARLLSDDGRWLVPVASYRRDPGPGPGLERYLSPQPLPAGEGIHGSLIDSRTSVLIAEMPRSSADRNGAPEAGATPARSMLIVPLRAHDRVIGTLELARGLPADPYSSEDQVLVQELADHAGQAIDNARLYEEAQRALKVRDEVMAIVSHDLRDPLSTIQMSAWLLSGIDLPVEQRQVQAEIIGRAAKRAERLIQDLLDVARMEAGKFSVERVDTDIGSLIEETCVLLLPRLEEQGLTLERAVAPDLPTIEADRHRVLQLLSNLVGNAIKFTPAGGRITIGGDASADQVRLWVRNTGDGIPAEQLSNLFDRFWQARQANRAGAGLGLSIVKGIVEAHGGSVWVESEVGAHATFYVTLPVAPGPRAGRSLGERSTAPEPTP